MKLSFILNVVVATWVCISAKTHKKKIDAPCTLRNCLPKLYRVARKCRNEPILGVNGRVKSVRMEYRCSHRGSWRIHLNSWIHLKHICFPLNVTTLDNWEQLNYFYLKVLILFFFIHFINVVQNQKVQKNIKQKVILPVFSPLTFKICNLKDIATLYGQSHTLVLCIHLEWWYDYILWSFFHYTDHKQHTVFYPAPCSGEAVSEEIKG